MATRSADLAGIVLRLRGGIIGRAQFRLARGCRGFVARGRSRLRRRIVRRVRDQVEHERKNAGNLVEVFGEELRGDKPRKFAPFEATDEVLGGIGETNQAITALNQQQRDRGITPQCDVNATLCGSQ